MSKSQRWSPGRSPRRDRASQESRLGGRQERAGDDGRGFDADQYRDEVGQRIADQARAATRGGSSIYEKLQAQLAAKADANADEAPTTRFRQPMQSERTTRRPFGPTSEQQRRMDTREAREQGRAERNDRYNETVGAVMNGGAIYDRYVGAKLLKDFRTEAEVRALKQQGAITQHYENLRLRAARSLVEDLKDARGYGNITGDELRDVTADRQWSSEVQALYEQRKAESNAVVDQAVDIASSMKTISESRDFRQLDGRDIMIDYSDYQGPDGKPLGMVRFRVNVVEGNFDYDESYTLTPIDAPAGVDLQPWDTDRDTVSAWVDHNAEWLMQRYNLRTEDLQPGFIAEQHTDSYAA